MLQSYIMGIEGKDGVELVNKWGMRKVQRFVIISSQQELEQHKAPKASQSEGFLTWSLIMLTSEKKKGWKYH